VDFLRARTLDEALQIKSGNPRAIPLAGGTDVMVELNFDRSRPHAIVDLTPVEELAQWSREDGWVRVGAGVTYARVISDLGDLLPALAVASRTVGSPQIRNRGTVGGNLGTSSPAGDALPPLMASGARVEVASVRGARSLGLSEFLIGPKRNALEPDELIVAVRAPAATGPQQFSKIGTRNAMVIAVAAFALALDPEAATIGTGIGSAGPVVLRAQSAERFLASELSSAGLWESRAVIPAAVRARFGELVGEAARPIDDVRGTAAYRRRALSVMARRTLEWAWDSYAQGA
jgi:CO/xanthine dehydrogenase FAD-binding subunit